MDDKLLSLFEAFVWVLIGVWVEELLRGGAFNVDAFDDDENVPLDEVVVPEVDRSLMNDYYFLYSWNVDLLMSSV